MKLRYVKRIWSYGLFYPALLPIANTRNPRSNFSPVLSNLIRHNQQRVGHHRNMILLASGRKAEILLMVRKLPDRVGKCHQWGATISPVSVSASPESSVLPKTGQTGNPPPSPRCVSASNPPRLCSSKKETLDTNLTNTPQLRFFGKYKNSNLKKQR